MKKNEDEALMIQSRKANPKEKSVKIRVDP
jgi:hypothetical protein